MEGDEIVGAAAPVEVTQEAEPETGDPQEGVDFEVVGENRYRWLNENVVTDAEGNAVEDEVEPVAATTTETPVAEAVVTPAPAPKATVTPMPAPATATAPRTATETPSRPIYTREATKAAIYTDDALNSIAETRYTDPLKAERMMADLNERYQDAIRSIDRVSNETFEQEMDEVVAQAPRAATDARIARHIQRVKDQMTPEQRQSPGAAKWAFGQAMATVLSGDVLAAEELYLRSTTHQRADTPPAPRRPAPAAVIPREERMPGPGSARRAVRPTRPAGAGGPDAELKKYAAFQKQLHSDWSDEDCLAVAKASLDAVANQRSPR